LFLVPRTRFQTYALVVGSDLALGAYLYAKGLPTAAFYRLNGIAVVVCMYLPALVMVLRRPNEGVLPGWLERLSRLLPSSLRGRATPAALA
jgi:hypothetical protein